MKRLFTLIFIAAGAAAVSCVEEKPFEVSQSVDSGIPIEFSLPVPTKAILDTEDGKTMSFEDGDVVGIFQYYKHDGAAKATVSATANNVPYKYVAATGKFVPVDAHATWGGTADVTHNLYVYYPYDETAQGISSNDNKLVHTLPSSQAYDGDECRIIDYGFAWARKNGATFGSAIEFGEMTQFFSVFRLNIENNTDSEVTISSVDLAVTSKGADGNNKYLAGTFDLWLNALTEGGNASSSIQSDGRQQKITATVSGGTVAAGAAVDVRFMIRPSDYTGANFTVDIVTDKGNYQATFTGGNITAGARASKSIKLLTESVESAYAVGDVVEGGVLYWISKDGTTGKVLYPNRSEKISFSTESPAPGLTTESSETDGEANVSAMKAADATLAKYPSAKYCDDLDGDWYLPAKNELRDLLSVYNGTYDPDADPGTWKVTNARPEGLTDPEKAARAAFDAYISNAGGVILNTASESSQGDVYWASTWATSFENSRTIRFGQRSDSSKTVTEKCYTRCIKKVSLSAVSSTAE